MTPHDRPTAEELVEAVREFLERDVMTATSGRVQFHTRVAMNVLAMVQRELAAGATADADHAAGLRALGYGTDAELAAAIRSGGIAADDPELLAFLRKTVRAKLEVANPKYLDEL